MFHPLRRLAAVAAVALGLPLLWTGSASAHFLGYDSVVNSKIDYVDNTKYDDARGWARDRWEDAGDVDIQLDTGWTKADVEFYDSYSPAASWAGSTTTSPATTTSSSTPTTWIRTRRPRSATSPCTSSATRSASTTATPAR